MQLEAVGLTSPEKRGYRSRASLRCAPLCRERACGDLQFLVGRPRRDSTGEDSMSAYQWTPPGKPGPFLTYRFCKTCGVRIYATGDAEFMGGKFYALAVATFDNVTTDWPLLR
jgi:hypothetical protein